ncbi:hypothetical protein CTAYLR_004590 [Chrysophaeum taylorii]|uniref:Poly [ADP-ribose] polymerase n=1 Tax=Chrysophaeum taylorii TaxID=2483200 RepID=A0AAD7UFH0_9STRA|nr:hypothetical protein CTAYLR_004590 [Chrysophaeum taylorii]
MGPKKKKKSGDLEGYVFVLCGKLSKTHALLTAEIEARGGVVKASVEEDVTHAVSASKTGKKVGEAESLGIAVVEESWLARKKAKVTTTKKTTTPTKKKAGLSGVSSPDAKARGVVDKGLGVVDASVAQRVRVHEDFDARLALVEPTKNSDKYYLLQLVADTSSSSSFWCFARWGRTGTSGQGKLDGPFGSEAEGAAVFEAKFLEKSGYEWADRKNAAGNKKIGKYEYLNAYRAAGADEASWQYYLQNDPRGQPDGWYDYDESNSAEVEEVYASFQQNRGLSTRFVTSESSGFSYKVDLATCAQTNTSTGMERPIRRRQQGVPAEAVLTTTTTTVDSAAPAFLRAGAVRGGYDATLNQTDLRTNANKFIKVQLVETRAGVVLHKRWGRVGEPGQQQQVGPTTPGEAAKEFRKYFRSKTGNSWGEDFEPKAGKYTVVEAPKTTTTTADSSSGGSSLDSRTKEFVSLIFNEDVFASAMADLEIDAKRLPLGALSKAQVQRGRDVLVRLKAVVGTKKTHLVDELTSEFYTLIPHAFGRRKPPRIDAEELLAKKFEMLETLEDIETAQAAMKESSSSSKQQHPLDQRYESLRVDLEAPTRREYELIETYVKKSPSTRLKLEAVFRVNRHGETFGAAEGIGNRRLLWHGTRVAAVAAVLKSGLRIMPHSGGRVGKGIYLADAHEKSLMYAGAGGGKIVMFLVEAALGVEHSITSDDPTLAKAPGKADCVVARGVMHPDPSKDAVLTIDGNRVVVPRGDLVKSPYHQSSSFRHNEYLIYDPAQHRIRYVLQFTTAI